MVGVIEDASPSSPIELITFFFLPFLQPTIRLAFLSSVIFGIILPFSFFMPSIVAWIPSSDELLGFFEVWLLISFEPRLLMYWLARG
jgi:hypothetical protein